MNSQQNRVNDYRALSGTVIDLRQAWLFVFIDAIVYLFAAQRLLGVLLFFFLLWLDMKQDQTGWSEFYTQKICFKVEPSLERYLNNWVIKNYFFLVSVQKCTDMDTDSYFISSIYI